MSTPLNIGIIMDPIAHIKPQTDTTLAMMLAAQELGGALFYMEQKDLYLEDGKAFGIAREIEVFDDPQNWFKFAETRHILLGTLDVIFMRTDPPVDKRYIHTTYMLEQASRDGARVLNDPASLRNYNEKIFATHFPEFCPAYSIGSDLEVLRRFLEQHGKIIIKPLDEMGGNGVFCVEQGDVNFEVIWEELTHKGTYPVMAQPFIPEISKGDSRIVILEGEAFGYAKVRLPKEGSIRGNLAVGGSYDFRPLNDREQEIATGVGKVITEKGIAFAGIDVIGDYLIEINITSPGGLRRMSKGCDTNPAMVLMQKIMAGC